MAETFDKKNRALGTPRIRKRKNAAVVMTPGALKYLTIAVAFVLSLTALLSVFVSAAEVDSTWGDVCEVESGEAFYEYEDILAVEGTEEFDGWIEIDVEETYVETTENTGTDTGTSTTPAPYIPPTYRLTFDTDGGTKINTRYYYYNDKISPPDAPTKEGWLFDTWDPALPERMPARSLTVKALWKLDTSALDSEIEAAETDYEKLLEQYPQAPEIAEALKETIEAAKEAEPATPEEVKALVTGLSEVRTASQTAAGYIDEWERYKKEKCEQADKELLDTDVETVTAVITETKETILPMKYDFTLDMDANKARVDAVYEGMLQKIQDIRAFETYKELKSTECKELGSGTHTEAAILEIKGLTYDAALSPEENNARVDVIVDKLQRALWETYREDGVNKTAKLLRSDDEDNVKKIVEDGIKTLRALTFDSKKTLSENNAEVDSLVKKISSDVEKNRRLNNPMSVKTKILTAKASKTKKFNKRKAFTVTKAEGEVTFKKLSGNKRIKLKSNGTVTVKRGLKKRKAYYVKVRVTAAGNDRYKPLSKTVKLKVKVK